LNIFWTVAYKQDSKICQPPTVQKRYLNFLLDDSRLKAKLKNLPAKCHIQNCSSWALFIYMQSN
jgi:hypothetical protein